jgi:hypothetical protein
MKSITKKAILFGLIISSLTIQVNAQIQYTGCSATGTNASAIGKNATASGNNSFAGGYNTQASGSNTFAFGYKSKATQSTNAALGNTAIASGVGSIAIGNYVKATAQNTFVFGSGTTSSYPLTNNIEGSIAFGVNSNKPTMLITKSLNNNYTGKVAIGYITSPQAKLHVKSDNNEDASVFLEPSDKNNNNACIKLFDDTHLISVDHTTAMQVNSGSGSLNFMGDSYCFGNQSDNKARIYTNGTPALYVNVKRNNGSEIRDKEGPSYAIDFNDGAMLFRTATYQNSTGSAITNWNNVLNITADGKVGINTTNKVSDFALAVDGGIISTKVHIKEVNQWPDHVFSEDHQLLGFDELKSYLQNNRHLPGIPSEKEVLENGYDVNEMQYLMLEKIEEMTRYILLLQDEINQLKTKQHTLNDSIVFSYDANGNRIARSLTFQKIDNQDPTANIEDLYDLFPNPTSDQFYLVLKGSSQDYPIHATLLTVSGVILEERDIQADKTTFDLSGRPNGIYLLEINGPGSLQTWKVIKQ